MIFGPEHSLVHISAGMTLDFSYFVTQIPLSNVFCRKYIGMSLCLTLGVTLLDSTTEIQLVLSSQCTDGAPVWIDIAYMYLQISLFILTALYMHEISTSLESEATSI